MSDLKTTYLTFMASLVLAGSPLAAEEISAQETTPVESASMEEAPTEEAPSKEATPAEASTKEPRVVAKFYSADAVQALPRLKGLKDQDPDHNKIIIRPENFPIDKEVFVEVKRLGSPTPSEYEPKFSFFVREDGMLQVSNSDHLLKAIVVGSRGYLPGELVSYRFHTADGTIDKEVSGVPTPAIVRDKEGNVVIQAEMVSIMPTVYKIKFPQMEDGEQYELKAASVGEIIKTKPSYVKTGFMYAPASKGISKGGDARLDVKRRNGNTYWIKLPWGAMLDGYLTGKKVFNPNPKE